ncbi:CHAT domain-containing protein [Kitasatospora sp. NPDC059646]|uniref:CHAT domain-containing protein n=1 Tax=Kitasatospora sp. NPDC059646 TaxID=3346893 RepID=UPI0036ABFC40
MNRDEALDLLAARLAAVEADEAAAAWFATAEAFAATAVLRAGGVPPAADPPFEVALVLGWSDLYGYAAGDGDPSLLGEALLCLLVVRLHEPERVPPDFAPALAAAAGEPVGADGPGVEQANGVAAAVLAAHLRWQHPGAPALAAALLRRAADDCPADDPMRGTVLSDLGLALVHDWFDRGALPSLAEAVRAGRAAVAAAPDAPGEQARRHGNLATALRIRSTADPGAGLVAEAVAEARTAIDLCPPDDPRLATYRAELGTCLALTGVLDDRAALPEAAAVLRETVRTDGPGAPGLTDRLSYLGMVLIGRAAVESDPGLRAEGIAYCRQAVAAADSAAARLQYLHNLGLALIEFGTGDDAEALAAALEAAELAPAGSPALAAAALTLARIALTRRHLAGGRPEDLAAAVARGTEALDATPPELTALRLERGSTLADLLLAQAQSAGADDPSAEPIALLHRLVGELPGPSGHRATALRHLADHLLESAAQHGRNDRAAEAADHYRECLALPSPGVHFEADVRFSLATALLLPAAPDDEAAWQQGLAAMERAIALLPEGDPLRLDLHYRLGCCRVGHAVDTRDPAGYREGLAVLGAVVAADEACGASERADHRAQLGFALMEFATRGGGEEHADRAVDLLEQALAMTPAGDGRRLSTVRRLADALGSFASLRSDTTALDRAFELLTRALAEPGGSPEGRIDCLVVLGTNLRLRYHFTGDPAHLERSVARFREAIALAAPAPHSRALVKLSSALSDLYDFRRDKALRAEAVDSGRAALALLPEHDPDTAAVRTTLGHLEWSLALEAGSEDLMDAALDTLGAALDAAPDGHADRPTALTNLGTAYLHRAIRTGDRSWELQAVTAFRAALESCGPTAAHRPLLLSNLGMALFLLAGTTGEGALEEEATGLLSEAAALPGGMAPARERAALNLAVLQFQQARAAEDVPASVEACRRFEDLVLEYGSPHPLRTTALIRLAIAGLATADLLPERAARTALRRAVAAAREALADDPQNADQVHPSARRVLAVAQLRRARLGEQVDLAEALRLVRHNAEDPALPPHTRLEAARLWGGIAAQAGWDSEALNGFAHAVGLLPRVAPRHLLRLDQEERLFSGRDVATSAAAFAIRAGDPERALALLEQGRGVLLAQGLENHGDLSRLRALDPARAAEFERIRDRLSREHPLARQFVGTEMPDAFFVHGWGDPSGAAAALHETEERRSLSRRWDRLLEEIRALPDLEDFLRPPSTRRLLSAAERGPVVVVNVSDYGSHALILAAPPGGEPRIDVLPLPGLTPYGLAVAVTAFGEHGIDLAYGDQGVAQAREMMRALGGVLEWLWDSVTGPVLERLRLRTTPLDGEDWPRLWWCPTGRLAFLPLHAAGKGQDVPGTWVMDRVVSSYTPTVRSLLRARRRASAAPAARRRPAPLVVSLARTPGGPPLPGAGPEAELVAELFPGGLRLDGEQARVAEVRRELDRHSWVHFSCHGVSDPASPSNSGLILHDGRLSAFDLSARRPVDAELAFLSACSTSQGGVHLPDEAVHLAPSFQLAGFTHVIGTLWTVSDRIARRLTEGFYAALREDADGGRPFDPALALHRPVRELREELLPAPHLWAAHVHIGP